MARPVLLVILLFVIVFTSQLDWNPQIVNEAEATPTLAQKQHHVTKRQEDIKEKIILSQEKNIHKLQKLVRSLEEQLLECRGRNGAVNDTLSSLTDILNDLEQKQILEDQS
ncbi:hypothetical protein RJ639_005963 [Escallonia herrerae]|uniref:Uncharacterized protein n=1 Tax=Escallonia herrerae TaxID=1293975 RepID=A0AA88W3V4_9ASTE|nr:hypothetical protein RJ639_005963 [Escallonia herrerae]